MVNNLLNTVGKDAFVTQTSEEYPTFSFTPPVEHSLSQAQKLKGLISGYFTSKGIQAHKTFPCLFVTKTNSFRIRTVSIAQIDSSFAQAQRWTRSIVKRILLEGDHSEREKMDLVSSLKSFEEKQLEIMGDMIPFIDKYLSLIHNELSSESTKSRYCLYDLFFALKRCIESQEIIYQKDPSKKLVMRGEVSHETRFEQRKQSIQSIKKQIQCENPLLCLPLLQDSETFSELYSFSPCLKSIYQYLDDTDIHMTLRALHGQDNQSLKLAELAPEQYFDHICTLLEKYASFEDVPVDLQHAFYQSRYIDLGILLELPAFSGYFLDSHPVLPHIEQCVKMEAIRFGEKAGSKEFLEKYFIDLVVKMGAHNLKLIDLGWSEITDDLLLQLPKLPIRVIGLPRTKITGRCLQGPIFTLVRYLDLSHCDQLNEEEVKKLSSIELREINMSCTQVRGSCAKGDAFIPLKRIDFSHCLKLCDKEVLGLVSKDLEEIDFSWTPIDGSCLEDPAFHLVRKIFLTACFDLKDAKLAKLSSTRLEEIVISYARFSGECLRSKLFENVTKLDLSDCENLTDENVFNLSSKVLKEANFSFTLLSEECLKGPAFRLAPRILLKKCINIQNKRIPDHLKSRVIL